MSIDHPLIVPIEETLKNENGRLFVINHLMLNGDLDDYIEISKKSEEPMFTDSELYQVLCTMVESVSFLHLRGMAHRDIKPANFLFDTNAKMAHLTDFGCLKFVGFKSTNILDTFDESDNPKKNETYKSKTGAGGCGTVTFMPPETFFQKKKGENSRKAMKNWKGYNVFKMDSFAVGATFYMVCHEGKYYQDFKNVSDIQANEKVKSWNGKLKFDSDIHPLFKWIIEGLMNPDPEERFSVT
jgi:serine/threonine protein kinase